MTNLDVSDEDLAAFIKFLRCADIGPTMITALAIAEDLQRLRGGWIPVSERLPKCSLKRDSFGVQVLISPPIVIDGCAPEHIAFFGCRVTREPSFYLHGRVVDVAAWRELPPPYVSKEGT